MVVAMTTIASLKHGKIPSSYIHQHILHLPQQTMKAKYRKLVATQGKGLDTASIEQLFLSFWPYCDFLNPDMLEYIVERFGDEISSDIVTMYVKRLREFRRKTVLKDMAGKWVGITPPGYVELSYRVLYVMEGERCVMELGVPLDETPQVSLYGREGGGGEREEGGGGGEGGRKEGEGGGEGRRGEGGGGKRREEEGEGERRRGRGRGGGRRERRGEGERRGGGGMGEGGGR